MGESKPSSLVAAAYILGSIGTLQDGEGKLTLIENSISSAGLDWPALLSGLESDPAEHALVKLAANLVDNNYPATFMEVFTQLGDEYQAVAYQALLIIFPSFSRSWDRRFEFADTHN